MAYFELGQPDRLVADYREAVSLEPSGVRWSGLAWARLLAGQNEPALADIDKSLALEPNDVYALDIRAHILAALGRTDAALGDFERAVALGGTDLAREYQKALVGHGYEVAVDGTWGPASRAALKTCLENGCRLIE